MLALTRKLLAMRNASDALLIGDMRIIVASEALLLFERSNGAERLLCVFNLGEVPLDWHPPESGPWRVVAEVGGAAIDRLPAISGMVLGVKEWME